jgi:nucleobase:cation symporter-1, NCS1 family
MANVSVTADPADRDAWKRAGFSEALINDDLAPAKRRNWRTWSIACMWMSDVHSVGGYVFAAGLFFLGLTGWQVLVALLVGICIVNYFMNKMGLPGHRLGVPYPVFARVSFGVFGANIPALIRAAIGIAWYGIQTWLASVAVVVLLIAVFPGLKPWTEGGFFGLSPLGWFAFAVMWALQLAVFYRGIETIRRFIDFCGPAVYVVMFLLAIWIVSKAGWASLALNLSDKQLTTGGVIYTMLMAAALVVSYFSTLLLNFGDFSRFTDSPDAVKRGNFWGLPVNFTAFSLVTVVVTAGTVAVFGEAILDPVEIVARIPNVFVVILGAATFVVATIGINIVANFVSPAYDLANVAPKYIDFKRGGLITSLAAFFVMPWHLYNSPVAINIFLGSLGAVLGPLYGIMMADYYLVKRQQVNVDDLFRATPASAYWYRNGVNMTAVKAFLPSSLIAIALALVPGLESLAPFSWFVGAGLGAGLYCWLAKGQPAMAPGLPPAQRA